MGLGVKVEDKIFFYVLYKINIENGVVLECSCVYLVFLWEWLWLLKEIKVIVNFKSLMGCFDIFICLIGDESIFFDYLLENYDGFFYLEICF